MKYGIGDVLMIQTNKNTWVCGKERLEHCDLELILDLSFYEVANFIKLK